MNLLNKLTLKNLTLNRKRTIVTIIGITLSVALITAVASVYASGISSLIRFETAERGNYHVVLYGVSDSDLAALNGNRAVENVYTLENLGYAEVGSGNEYKPYVCIKGISDDSFASLAGKLTGGRMPENGSEILIPDHLSTNGKINWAIGDTVTLDVGRRILDADGISLDQQNPLIMSETDGGEFVRAERIADTVTRTFTVVGTVKRPIYSIEQYSAPGYTLFTVSGSGTVSGTDTYIRFKKAEVGGAYERTAGFLGVDADLFTRVYKNGDLSTEEWYRFEDEMTDVKYGFSFNSYLIDLETDPFSLSAVKTLIYAVYAVILIIVLTSIFCIKNSFDISITEKIRQYGMLRSIGATKRQIRRNVFFEATILGAIGIPLGILCGFLAAAILMKISTALIGEMLSDGLELVFSFSWPAVAAAAVLGVITMYLSAFRSAGKAAKVSPIDSIRNSAGITVDGRKLKVPRIVRSLFGIGGEISYKNLKRNRKKYRTTVLSIIISVASFIALSAFMNGLLDQADREIVRSEYNVYVSATYENASEFERLTEVTHFDDVEECTLLRTSTIVLPKVIYGREYREWLNYINADEDSGWLSVVSVGDDQFVKFCRSLGLDSDRMKDMGIICDSDYVYRTDDNGKQDVKYMRITDLNAGDVISGVWESDTTGDRKDVEIEIACISESRPFGLKGWGGVFLVVSDELFDRSTVTTRAFIVIKTDNATKTAEETERHLRGMTFNVTNNDDSYRMFNNLFTLIGIFLYGFITVISLIGITNIFNTITTNMELRKPEFAMLRSVGMTGKEFWHMIRLESLFMGTRAFITGSVIGVILSFVMYWFITKESGYPYRFPVAAVLISALAVFVLIYLLMLYSVGKIKKLNTVETIRNENI